MALIDRSCLFFVPTDRSRCIKGRTKQQTRDPSGENAGEEVPEGFSETARKTIQKLAEVVFFFLKVSQYADRATVCHFRSANGPSKNFKAMLGCKCGVHI